MFGDDDDDDDDDDADDADDHLWPFFQEQAHAPNLDIKKPWNPCLLV